MMTNKRRKTNSPILNMLNNMSSCCDDECCGCPGATEVECMQCDDDVFVYHT
ncbi:hypothetical protein EXVG_00419 [Emiliania huxleyi virus 202]|nr:hypothetical protein EXVG_00419 [Emiliania huxleyi virus 202]AHA54376.1 hypothetical protein EhV18_00330 [Emiliania huxleyi virus 18]AHA55416.1 hypothetical protein EhV156_00321 [Emiliania huxleyi virus 156]